MRCPVCKSECGDLSKCSRCGFKHLQANFLSQDEVDYWMIHTVIPYREQWQAHRNATPVEPEREPLYDSGTPSFQDELKQNVRSPEQVRQEQALVNTMARMTEAKNTLSQIKRALVQSAQNADYTTKNGVTEVSCLCRIPQKFLRRYSENNGEQIRQNQKQFFLFRDPNLIYRTWECFDVEPKYISEYNQYISVLQQIAAAENISVEVLVRDRKENKVYPFPARIPSVNSIYWDLCVRASTNIGV